MNPTQQLRQLGQSLWLDNITRGMLNDGTLKRYVEDYAITGLTSNPSIFDKAIEEGEDYDESIRAAAGRGLSGEGLFFEIALEDLRRAAELFRPAHERTDGVDGWASLEVSPLLVDDASGTIAEVESLHARADVQNLFIKIPGTTAGTRAIEECIFKGIPINVTLLFSTEQYVASAEAFMRGIERRIDRGLNPAIPSVASLFVSRWDKAVLGKVPAELRDRLGIAVAMQAYRAYREILDSPRWQRLENEGARPQRLLWASTGTKDPEAPDVMYLEALAAPLTIDTIPDKTLLAFAEHGRAVQLMPPDGGDAEAVLSEFQRAGVDLQALAERLQRDGAEAFDQSWSGLLSCIERKTRQLAKD
jgi:transaldolase